MPSRRHRPAERSVVQAQHVPCHGFGDADAVDTGGQDAAGVAGAFTRREQPLRFRLWKLSPRVMRSGEEVRVSIPVSTASCRL
jgi:hypothetical protein